MIFRISLLIALALFLLKALLSLLPVPLVDLLVVEVELLGKLFDEVLVPITVFLEMELENLDLLRYESFVLQILISIGVVSCVFCDYLVDKVLNIIRVSDQLKLLSNIRSNLGVFWLMI